MYTWLSDKTLCNEYLGIEPPLNLKNTVFYTSMGFILLAFFIIWMPETKDELELQSNET
jgi:hypothetical protein